MTHGFCHDNLLDATLGKNVLRNFPMLVYRLILSCLLFTEMAAKKWLEALKRLFNSFKFRTHCMSLSNYHYYVWKIKTGTIFFAFEAFQDALLSILTMSNKWRVQLYLRMRPPTWQPKSIAQNKKLSSVMRENFIKINATRISALKGQRLRF